MNWLNAFGETVQTRPEALNGFGVAKDTELTKPSAFQGTGEALEKTLPFQFYQSVSGFNELLADRVEVNYDLDNNEDAFSDFQPTHDQKEQVANKLRQDAKFARLKAQNDYTPNPETTGQAAMMIHGLTGSLAKAIGYTVLTGGSGILAAPLFGADFGLYEAGKLRDKGVDESTARKAGAITGAVNAVGMALPGAVGTSYLKSMAFGGLVNPATDVSEQAAIKFVLENANYSKQAQEYDPFDPVNLGVSAGMGIAFGALGARANRAQARYLEAESKAAEQTVPQPQDQAAPNTNMNKSVLDSIQNRDRTSKESRLQMEKIAAAPNFNLLRESRSLDQGAPIIAYVPDDMNVLWGKSVEVSADPNSKPMTMRYAVVDADDVLTSNAVDGSSNPKFTDPTVAGARAIAGNGRIAGLQGAYRQVKATDYRADLTKDAKEFGISKRQIKKMKSPILVRIMDDADVVEGIGEASNRTGTLKLNPAEQAAQDARNVRLEEVEFTKDGGITRKSMDEFVRRTPDKEGLIDSNGNALYDNISRRMRPAIFAAAFSDTRIINRFIADSPEDRKIMNVLQSVAAEVVRLKKIKGELDFSPDLLEAVADVFETRREAKKINGKGHESELTGSLMEESATPAQRYFRDILLSSNPERLQDVLARFREVAEQESGGEGFWGSVTKDQVFDTVKSEFDQQEAAVNSIQPSHVDAAMELQHANVIQNDQPVGKLGDVNKSIADEKKAAEQIDNGERVEVSGEGVDPEAMDQQVSSFITRFVKELVGAGAERKVAEMGAKVHDAFFETLGIRLGKSRKELEQEYALRAQRGAGLETLEGFASMSPQERLDILNRSREFDEQLRLWEQGEGSNKFNLGKPSWVLQIFGASDRKGVNTTKRQFVHVLLPKGKKLLDIDGKHGIQATELKGLLVGIQQPIAVFKSATDGGIVLITELKRGDSPIIVPIHLTRTKDGDFQIVNFVASTYEKERTSINKWVEKGLLLGYDKTKGLNVLPRDFGSNPHLSRSADVTKTSANDKTLNPSVRPIVYQNETSIGDLYQSESALRGIYTPGERVITLMQSANESTFIHESGHYFLDVLTDVAMKENAPAQVKADVQTLMTWFGVKDLDEWRSLSIDEQRAAHEQFARGFEQYLREGEAPSSALEKVFEAFKDWLTKIYKSSEELQVEISPEVRAAYDRLLATDEQIRTKQEAEAPAFDFGMKPEEPTNPAVKTLQQTAEQMIDAAPIPEEGKTKIKETLGINQTEQQTGENHPRHKVMSDDEFVDNEFQKVLEDQPGLKIYDENGKEIDVASFMETTNQKAQELRRTANSMGEAALCMWNQGGLEDL